MENAKKVELHNALKKHYGAFKEIAKRAEVTTSYVWYVLRGERNSTNVLTIACEVLAERQKKEASQQKRQQKLMAKANEYALAAN